MSATAGKWNEKHKRYIPSFYELGVFQTPAGDHGCTNEAGVKACRYRPPGRNVENSQFGKGWRRLAGAYATEGNWKDPTMQVRIGLWDLTSTADRVHTAFADLFPSRRSHPSHALCEMSRSAWPGSQSHRSVIARGHPVEARRRREIRKQIVVLPDVSLQQPVTIRTAINDFRCCQFVA